MPLSDGQREVLQTLVKSRIAAHRDVQRAQALLLAADGAANTQTRGGFSETALCNSHRREEKPARATWTLLLL